MCPGFGRPFSGPRFDDLDFGRKLPYAGWIFFLLSGRLLDARAGRGRWSIVAVIVRSWPLWRLARKAQATHSARFLMGRWLRVAWRMPSMVCLRLRLSCEKSEWWGAVWKAFCIAWGPNENPHCISKAFANAFSNYFACVAFRSRAAAIALNKNNEGRLARRP